MTCEHIHDSGPYLLGALSPAERAAYELHLAECAECRAEVADLAALPALLARVDARTAEAIADGGEEALRMLAEDPLSSWDRPTAWDTPTGWAGPTLQPADEPNGGRGSNTSGSNAAGLNALGPNVPVVIAPPTAMDRTPDATLSRVLDLAHGRRRRERRQRRWQTAGAALVAACLAVAAVIGIRAANVGGPTYREMKTVAADSPVSAGLALEAADGGTLIRMQCRYRGEDHGKWTFRLVVLSKKNGDAYEVSNWTATYGDELNVSAHSRLKPGDIQRIELRLGDGTPLLTYGTT